MPEAQQQACTDSQDIEYTRATVEDMKRSLNSLKHQQANKSLLSLAMQSPIHSPADGPMHTLCPLVRTEKRK